jgi:hypothetical protein
MAKTYGLLPSEVAQRATTFDIMVTDVYTTWENYKNNPNDISNYDVDALAELVKQGKGHGG